MWWIQTDSGECSMLLSQSHNTLKIWIRTDTTGRSYEVWSHMSGLFYFVFWRTCTLFTAVIAHSESPETPAFILTAAKQIQNPPVLGGPGALLIFETRSSSPNGITCRWASVTQTTNGSEITTSLGIWSLANGAVSVQACLLKYLACLSPANHMTLIPDWNAPPAYP